MQDQFQIKNEPLSNGAMSRLIIRQVKMDDSAEFLCLAENSYGRANKTIILTVQVNLY